MNDLSFPCEPLDPMSQLAASAPKMDERKFRALLADASAALWGAGCYPNQAIAELEDAQRYIAEALAMARGRMPLPEPRQYEVLDTDPF